MIITKYNVVNFLIFVICSSTFLILFSNLENESSVVKLPAHRQPPVVLSKSSKLFDLNFKYFINNDVCQGDSDILAVIIVTSYYGNIETRSAMRRTVPVEELRRLKLRRVFLLAVGPENNKFDINSKALSHENKRFNDIIQGNFNEAYRNLTYKHVMGLQWASEFCKMAKYVIKMDDDIVFNVNKVLKVLEQLSLPDNVIAGYILKGMVPIREPANKWYVTRKEYKNSLYPPFVSGWFYIVTPKTAQRLVQQSHQAPYFWIDDVYVTGILAKQLKIKHLNLNDIYAVHYEYLLCCLNDVEVHSYDCEFLIGPNGGDNNLFYTFNKMMSKCDREVCKKRQRGKELNRTCVAQENPYIGRGRAVIETVRLF